MKSVLFPNPMNRRARSGHPSPQSRSAREFVSKSLQQQRLHAADRSAFRAEEHFLNYADVAASGASLLSWADEVEERLGFAEERVSAMLRNLNFLQGLEAVFSSVERPAARAPQAPPGPKPPNSGRPAQHFPAQARQAWAQSSNVEVAPGSSEEEKLKLQQDLGSTLARKLETLECTQNEQKTVQARQLDRLEVMRRELDDLIAVRPELVQNYPSVPDAAKIKQLEEDLHKYMEGIITDRLDMIAKTLRRDTDAAIADGVSRSMSAWSQEFRGEREQKSTQNLQTGVADIHCLRSELENLICEKIQSLGRQMEDVKTDWHGQDQIKLSMQGAHQDLQAISDMARGRKLETSVDEKLTCELEANNHRLERLEEMCKEATPDNQQLDILTEQLEASNCRLLRLEETRQQATLDSQQLEILKEQLEASHRRLERLEETRQQATPDEQQLDTLREELQASHRRLERLEETCKQATPEDNQQLDTLKEQLDASNRRLERLEETRQQATPDEQQLDTLREELQASNRRLESLEETCKQATPDNQQLDTLREQLEASSHRLERLEETCKQVASDNQQLDTLHERLEESSHRLERLEETCKQASPDKQQWDTLKEQLETSISRLEKLEEMCKQAAPDNLQLDALKEHVGQVSSQQQQLSSHLTAMEDRLGRVEATHRPGPVDTALASERSGDVLAQCEGKHLAFGKSLPQVAAGSEAEVVLGEDAGADGKSGPDEPSLPKVASEPELTECAPEVVLQTTLGDDANAAKDKVQAIPPEPLPDLAAFRPARGSGESDQDDGKAPADDMPRPPVDPELENEAPKSVFDPAIQTEEVEEDIAQDDGVTIFAAVIKENQPQASLGPSVAEEPIAQDESINALAGTPLNQETLVQGDGISATDRGPSIAETPISQGDSINAAVAASSQDPFAKPDAALDSDGGRGDIPQREAECADGEQSSS